MKEFWRLRSNLLERFFLVCSLFVLCFSSFCWSLNDEGVALLKIKERIVTDPQGALSSWIEEVGVENPCSWFGVGCSHGYVVALNLTDLCLRGTLTADVGKLIHIKAINLCNNSFSGAIPDEIESLKELQVLDLRFNNFSGQLPYHLANNSSTVILFLDNNELLGYSCPECKQSENQVNNLLSRPGHASSCNGLVISWKSREAINISGRKLLQEAPGPKRPTFQFQVPPLTPRNLPPLSPRKLRPPPPVSEIASISPAPAPVPSPSLSPEPFEPSSSPSVNQTSTHSLPTPAAEQPETQRKKSNNRKLIIPLAIGGSLVLAFLLIGFVCYRGKVATVSPWATGLSGQLQRALVNEVPKLKRSELEAACEDFSNVIGSLSVCTLYKGTLSSGVEIAVASITVESKRDWSSSMESQFTKKVEGLSKVNHKNFISLLGYCEEEEPFTRMLVFEYAPNGTLFEHLHIKEAEHLDWEMRLRVAMGIAYCLDHMHQMTPAVAHRNLTSSSVCLTEDYAAKVSDFIFWDNGSGDESRATPHSNVYSFGVLLFEMITGKLPYSSGNDSVEDWASDYLTGAQPLSAMIDPTLASYRRDQLEQIEEVIKLCAEPDLRRRPSMANVCALLREITGIGPDGATPRRSPVWWAEIEIQSAEAA